MLLLSQSSPMLPSQHLRQCWLLLLPRSLLLPLIILVSMLPHRSSMLYVSISMLTAIVIRGIIMPRHLLQTAVVVWPR